MVQYTEESRRLRQEYLEAVARYARSTSGRDADKLLAQVEGYLERELARDEQIVTTERMEALLERLGQPSTWASSPSDPQILDVQPEKPGIAEDWRLAYLTVATLILAAAVGSWVTALLSFFVARAAVSLARGESLGSRRWLVYPSLLLTYCLVGVAVLFLPWALLRVVGLGPVAGWAEGPMPPSQRAPLLDVVEGLWMIGLALLLRSRYGRRWLPMIFRPWAADRWSLRWLITLGAVFLIAGVGSAVLER